MAQKIDHLASFRDVGSAHYFKLHYDNDLFTSTDKDYTQGYNFEFANPKFKKNPINFLFFNFKDTEHVFGLAIESTGYTPKDIKSKDIQFGDRAVCSNLYDKKF